MADAHKGIMLAERPAHASNQTQAKAFLPACATEKLEPVGLNPLRKVHAAHAEEKPPGITFHHKHWLKEFEGAQRGAAEAQQRVQSQEDAKKEAVTAFAEKLRSTILSGGKVSEFWRAAAAEEQLQQQRTAKAAAAAAAATAASTAQQHAGAADAGATAEDGRSLQGIDDFVEQACMEASAAMQGRQEGRAEAAAGPTDAPSSSAPAAAKAQDGSRPATSGGARGGKKAASKPAWALSEGEIAAKEEDEELELLNFAENLDFDSFVGTLDDVELQDTFKALQEAEASEGQGGKEGNGNDAAWRKSFVRALNHVAFKQMQGSAGQRPTQQDEEGSVAGKSEGAHSRATHTSRARSEATAARLAAAAGRAEDAEGKWDSSSKAGDARTQAAASKLLAAEEFLLENPELKGVHSNASVRAMLSKAEVQAGEPIASN